jgi:hypothetical protein
VCFRVGDQDAKKLEAGLSSFDAADLCNLGTGEAIVRLERPEFDFNLRIRCLPEVDREAAAGLRERIVARSRERYGTPREDVEAELLRARGAQETEPAEIGRVAKSVEPVQPPIVEPPPSVPTAEPAPGRPPRPKAVVAGAVPEVAEPALMGRGGAQHRYIQQLIKQYAEGLGYKASIEENVLGGRGIDVALSKGEVTIACEICITTDDAHELGNVRKCLAAGYKYVAVVAPDAKRLGKLKAAIEVRVTEAEAERLRFFTPESLLGFVQGLEVRKLDTEKTLRGYKVRTTYKALDADEAKDRREAISRVVAKAVTRLRKRDPGP